MFHCEATFIQIRYSMIENQSSYEFFHYVIELFNRTSIRKCKLEKYAIPLDEHQICLKGVNLVFGNINMPYYFGLRILLAMAEGSRILTQTAIIHIYIFFENEMK